jgi:hypothetical protein
MKQETYDWINSQFGNNRDKFRIKMVNDMFFSEVIYKVADWIEQGIVIKHNQETANKNIHIDEYERLRKEAAKMPIRRVTKDNDLTDSSNLRGKKSTEPPRKSQEPLSDKRRR